MNKKIGKNKQAQGICRGAPTQRALYLLWIGAVILLAGILDVAIRLWAGLQEGAVGIMLHLGYEIECLLAGVAIWLGGMLLLDYLELRHPNDG